MKRLHLALGIAFFAASAAVAHAADAPAATTPPPASSDTTQTPPATPPATDAKSAGATQLDPNEQICKRVRDDETDTRMGTRVCKTRKEWDEGGKS